MAGTPPSVPVLHPVGACWPLIAVCWPVCRRWASGGRARPTSRWPSSPSSAWAHCCAWCRRSPICGYHFVLPLGSICPICNAHVLQLASAIVHVRMAPKVSNLRVLLVLPLTASSQSAGCCAPSRSRLRQPHRIDWPEPCCIYCSKACKIWLEKDPCVSIQLPIVNPLRPRRSTACSAS